MKENTNLSANIIRWIARILGTLFLAFVLFFLFAYAFGEDQSGEGFRSTGEFLTFILFPISTVIGLLVAYKWEGTGGLIITAGMAGLFIVRPELLSSAYMIIPVIPGILYISYWLLTKRKINRDSAQLGYDSPPETL